MINTAVKDVQISQCLDLHDLLLKEWSERLLGGLMDGDSIRSVRVMVV